MCQNMLTMKRTNESEMGSQYQDLKERLHQHVIELLDLNAVSTMSQDAVELQLTKLVEQLLQQESAPLNQRERVQITQGVIHEVLGLGPLEPLLADTTINDILVNGHKQVFVRSEEHTSELQSRLHLVCRLLLEKKKTR